MECAPLGVGTVEMNRNLMMVAKGMYTLAAVLGLPSLLGTVLFGWFALQMHLASPATNAKPGPVSSDALIGTAQQIFRAAGSAIGFFGSVVEGLATGLAVACAIVFVFAIGMYFTGRGVANHETWARILGILFAVLLLLVSSAGMLIGGRIGATAALAMAVMSGYSFWILCSRYV